MRGPTRPRRRSESLQSADEPTAAPYPLLLLRAFTSAGGGASAEDDAGPYAGLDADAPDSLPGEAHSDEAVLAATRKWVEGIIVVTVLQ